jgi:DNA-binding GntR family transcriptional regulator
MPYRSESPAYRDLTDWVVLCVLESVRRGDIRPGERLVEHEVAARFGVSRAPVRDALHKLETLGVVERRRPRGVYVRAWTDQDATEVLELMDALILLSVQLSVDKLSPEDLRELAEVVEESGRLSESVTADPARQLELDLRFHMIIARKSGNRRVAQLIETLGLPMQLYARETYGALERGFAYRIHTDLLEALRRRDKSAAVASVLRHAPESEAVFARAVQGRVPAPGDAAPMEPPEPPVPGRGRPARVAPRRPAPQTAGDLR